MDTSMFGGSHGDYRLLAPPTVHVNTLNNNNTNQYDDDENNNLNFINVNQEDNLLPNWLKKLLEQEIIPTEGIPVLISKYMYNRYQNRIKRIFDNEYLTSKKNRSNDDKNNDNNNNNHIIQIVLIDVDTILRFSKDGMEKLLINNNKKNEEEEEQNNVLTLTTTYHIYLELLCKKRDLMVAFHNQHIEMRGNMLISFKLKKLIEIFAVPIKFPMYKLYKITCWRWVLISGMQLTYIDRHGQYYKTDRVGKVGWQDSTEDYEFILEDDEVLINMDVYIGNRRHAGGRDGLGSMTFSTNKNRTWKFGIEVGGLRYNTDMNFNNNYNNNHNQISLHETLLHNIRNRGNNNVTMNNNNNSRQDNVRRKQSSSYIHCFRLRAADNIHAIGVGAIKDPQLFKRLKRNNNTTNNKNKKKSTLDGNKYFPVWTVTNHHKFLLHDRKAIETFYFIILYNKALFQVLQGNDSVLIPEALIRYILQFY